MRWAMVALVTISGWFLLTSAPVDASVQLAEGDADADGDSLIGENSPIFDVLDNDTEDTRRLTCEKADELGPWTQ